METNNEKISKLILLLFATATLATACSSSSIQFSTPDEILDELDGTSNHANNPDNNL